MAGGRSVVAERRRRRNGPGAAAALGLLRPWRWPEHLLVFAPLFFGGLIAWGQTPWRALLVFLCFCMASNAIAIFAEEGEAPANRPGTLAGLFSLVLAVAAIAGACLVSINAGVWVIAYAVLGLIGGWLNRWAPLLALSARSAAPAGAPLAGYALAELAPSPWLLLLVFLLALLVSFGSHPPGEGRRGGRGAPAYDDQAAAQAVAALAAANLAVYGLYCVSPNALARPGGNLLVFTVPIVAYALLRYLHVAGRRPGEEPGRLLLTDGPLLLATLCWVAACGAIVYG